MLNNSSGAPQHLFDFDVTPPPSSPPGRSHVHRLVLSIFPGIDLLGTAFEMEGFHVLRGPDPLWGGDVRDFNPPRGVFEGIIGGPPCQDFSAARRSRPTGAGVTMLQEFIRVVEEAEPLWFLMENTPRVPDVTARGYSMQRFFLDARECGSVQRRHRRFQFGDLAGKVLVFPPPTPKRRDAAPCCMATEGTKKDRRSWEDFCELQGLPRSFDLPGLGVQAAYRAVGNGVPIPMGRTIARAILNRVASELVRICVCGCGRLTSSTAAHASASCRKRMERARRDRAAFPGPRNVTP